jgi:hypothetical protein
MKKSTWSESIKHSRLAMVFNPKTSYRENTATDALGHFACYDGGGQGRNSDAPRLGPKAFGPLPKV